MKVHLSARLGDCIRVYIFECVRIHLGACSVFVSCPILRPCLFFGTQQEDGLAYGDAAAQERSWVEACRFEPPKHSESFRSTAMSETTELESAHFLTPAALKVHSTRKQKQQTLAVAFPRKAMQVL